MDSDAGSSRRRRRLSSPLLRYSSLFVSFVDFLQVCLLYLGFLSYSFVNGCASSRRCRIQTVWIMFLTCSPPSSIMAALVSDLTCEVCACTALSRFPKNVRRTDLPLSSSSWAMNFLPTGKICSNFPRCERSFRIVIFRGSFVRSTSLVCSELYSSSSAANLTLSEDPKSHRLLLPLPFTAAKPGVCSTLHNRTNSGYNQLNSGSITFLWLRYGNIGVRSVSLAIVYAVLPNLVKLIVVTPV
ncbi:hypothetical protein F2Q70_00032787 [Brassica cretica]|uniref:Uncharacterized protein n=1 Tax=Brassica cretica TaxID=69181 RepID=A0A8S9FJL0_BRACR|nr:hypothetical protein F2Q70_00032787 [Brassica cretica]